MKKEQSEDWYNLQVHGRLPPGMDDEDYDDADSEDNGDNAHVVGRTSEGDPIFVI
jgi:hypothetical protein